MAPIVNVTIQIHSRETAHEYVMCYKNLCKMILRRLLALQKDDRSFDKRHGAE